MKLFKSLILPIAVLVAICFDATTTYASMEPLEKPFDCEALLDPTEKMFLFHSDDWASMEPILTQAVAQNRNVVLFVQPRDAAKDTHFTKSEVMAVKKQIKQLGGELYPATTDYVTYWSLQIIPNVETLAALPVMLNGLAYDLVIVQFTAITPPRVKAPKASKSNVSVSSKNKSSSGRQFVNIAIEDFRDKIPQNVEDFRELSAILAKDLGKVEYDSENHIYNPNDLPEWQNLIGYHTLPNGLTYLGVIAGGDSESPIFFAVYWDGQSLRAYIPKEGNLWNPKTKAPFGSNPLEDLEYLQTAGHRFAGKSDMEILTSLKLDAGKLLKDLSSRLVPSER